MFVSLGVHVTSVSFFEGLSVSLNFVALKSIPIEFQNYAPISAELITGKTGTN